ncbi:SRPBCC family protein [Microbacterium sp. USHLN186]|uniref:SRPBCC family protein n=1 Tax=Microbacterium sp. USHLN186 TaxID=3081286 RepID=UPI003018AF44
MATNRRYLRCAPEAVFRVLGDGWLYPAWVVAAARMREVDASWPAPDATLSHSVGTWPFLLNGTTDSVEWAPPHRAVMQAKGWPIGEARVVVEVEPAPGGCLVSIHETPVRGIGAAIPAFLTAPVIRWRNSETLRRLSYLAESDSLGSRGGHPERGDLTDVDPPPAER